MKTSEDIASIRQFILRAASKFPRGCSASILESACLQAGIHFHDHDGPDSLSSQLNYLAGKGLIEPVTSKLAGGLDCWKLTAEGDDFLRSN